MKTVKLSTIFIVSLCLQILCSSYTIAQEEHCDIHEAIEKISNVAPGTIILLNGTSSAGKSTLIYELQKAHYPSFHMARIDDFMKTPKGYNKKTRYHNFYTHIKKIALSGKSVLVDTVSYQQNYEKYDAILQPCKVIKVLVYCPLDTLIMHVQQRNDSGDLREKRSINQAFWQYLTLYTMQQSSKDIIIDHTTTNQIKDSLEKAEALTKHLPSKRIRQQRKTNNGLAKEFQTKTSRSMAITPKHRWDFIVNTSIDSPENIAQKIVDYLESKFIQHHYKK